MKSRSALVVLAIAALLGGGVGVAIALLSSSSTPSNAADTNPMMVNTSVDPGTRLSGPAPDFTLTDQFGRKVSLRQFRGKVVVLAFNDPVCTTICPLTTTAMVEAKRMLGVAGSQVQLLGIGANPEATGVKWVRAYSRVHGMLHDWHFLTGSLPQLKRVWKEYGIAAQVVHGAIDHTPALYVIDTRGREAKLYMTQMAYAGVQQQAKLLATDVAQLLPSHPQVHSGVSEAQVPAILPTARTQLAAPGGEPVRVGPGAPRLYLFFASWVSETSDLRQQIAALDDYEAFANVHGLPRLTAVDEGSVEPSPRALPDLLRSLGRKLSFPVAVDPHGRLADGYRVRDLPWLALISSSGRFLWYYDVSAAGWPGTQALVAHVRAALAHAVKSRSPVSGAGAAS